MDAAALGRLIAARRREKQMTQAELAAALHVTSKAVSRWERGVGYPDITTLEPLAAALGLRPAELLACARDGAGQAAAVPAGPVREQTAAQKTLRRAFWRLFARAFGAVAGVFLLSALAHYLLAVFPLTGQLAEYYLGLAAMGVSLARSFASGLAGLLLRRGHRALLAQGPLLRRRWALGLAALLPAVCSLLNSHSRLMRMLYGFFYGLLEGREIRFKFLVALWEEFCSLGFGLSVLACAFLVFTPLWRPKRGPGGAGAQQ